MDALFLAAKIYALAVVISLAVAVLIKVLGLLTAAGHRGAVPADPPVIPAATPAPEEDVAIITAALTAAMGAHRIVHLEERARGQAWTAEGRSAHHASHAPHASGHPATPPDRKR